MIAVVVFYVVTGSKVCRRRARYTQSLLSHEHALTTLRFINLCVGKI